MVVLLGLPCGIKVEGKRSDEKAASLHRQYDSPTELGQCRGAEEILVVSLALKGYAISPALAADILNKSECYEQVCSVMMAF